MKNDIFSTVEQNNLQAYSDMIKSSDINVLDCFNRNLLIIAIVYSANEIARDLIERGIDLTHPDKNKFTPLHFCCEYENLEITELLLTKGVPVDPVEKFGNTPLWRSVFKQDYNTAESLIKHGADPKHRNLAGKSPLDFAMQRNDDKMVDILNRKK